MGRNCIVFGCSNTQEKGVSLFKFPTESKLRKAWTLQVQRTRDKWKGPSKYSAICCEHFTEECFELTSRKLGIKMKPRLKSTAVPTIFPRPPSSTTVPKRLRASSAFEKRERARVTYSYYTIIAQSHYWSVRYSLRLPLLVRMPLLVQMQYLSNRWIEPELMI